MRRKKLSMFLVATILCLTLSACGTTNRDNESNAEQQVQTQEIQIQETENQETGNTVEQEAEIMQNTETSAVSELGTYPDGSSPVYSGIKCKLTVDGEEVIIAMYDNTAADAFLERLPLADLEFYDLSGIEKPVQNPEEPFSIEDETPGYDPVTGEMVIYRPWGNFTIFYGDFRHSDELVPLGKVESGLEILAGKTDDFTGTLEMMDNSAENTASDMAETENILIAYFTWADNTYVEDPSLVDIDATTSASVLAPGNVGLIASWIQEDIGGDLFSIRVTDLYSSDYDACLDRASEENAQNARPELATHVENMEQYDTIYIGYPNWWYSCPMALLSFLEEYDFSGKHIVLFCSHGTGGLSGSVDAIMEVLPDDCTVETDVLGVYRPEVADSKDAVLEWLQGVK